VRIQVQANQSDGPISPVWNYFGYDEPNYTYAPNGRKLLGELAAANVVPVYVRTHNLLTSGDGSASLKWGSTNVYSEDASGHPIYSWAILDQIFDTFHATRSPIVMIFHLAKSVTFTPDGPIRRTIIRSGPNLFFSSFAIFANATAMLK
jgi:xylan 1,4-beta-xylosidase